MAQDEGTDHCRLCGSTDLARRFSATIMARREIDYFECGGCGSLQTETPDWLDEAYSLHLGSQDCGAVQRNLDNAALCLLVARLWKLRDAFDFGGGDGMLTRLVRDYGVNCFLWDKYAAPVYAQGFTEPDFATLEMLFSFEVFEHFDAPARQIDELFERRPALLLSSTGLYHRQRSDWPYLSLNSGRHIFFYSARAMAMIARKHGYAVRIEGQYILFVRDDLPAGWRMAVFGLLTRRRLLRLLRSFLLSRRPFGAGRDKQLLGERTAAATAAPRSAHEPVASA